MGANRRTLRFIGRNQARCSCEPGLLNPPFKPCIRISRTRLTDGLSEPHSCRPRSSAARPVRIVTPNGHDVEAWPKAPGGGHLAVTPSLFRSSRALSKGLLGPKDHSLTLTSIRDLTKVGPLPSRGVLVHRDHQYYEPLGLPSGTVTLHLRLIVTAFVRRGPPGRASPVPHQTVSTCPLPYPGSVLCVSGPTSAQSVAFTPT